MSNIYIFFTILWGASIVFFIFSLCEPCLSIRVKKNLGSLSIVVEFFAGITLCPFLFSFWGTDSIVKDLTYLAVSFGPVFVMTQILAISIKKQSKMTQKLNVGLLAAIIVSILTLIISLVFFDEFNKYAAPEAQVIGAICLLPSIGLICYLIYRFFKFFKRKDQVSLSPKPDMQPRAAQDDQSLPPPLTNKTSIQPRLAKLSDRQKIFFGMAVVAIIMLLAALPESSEAGFYTFLRIVTSAALIGLLLEKFPVWLKFMVILFLILYNPVIQVHLGDKDIWRFFNVVTIPILAIPWLILLRRRKRLQDEPLRDLQKTEIESTQQQVTSPVVEKTSLPAILPEEAPRKCKQSWKKKILFYCFIIGLLFVLSIGKLIGQEMANVIFTKIQTAQKSSIVSFDDQYRQMASEVSAQFIENIDYIASIQTKELEREYALVGIKLNNNEKRNLQVAMLEVLMNIDFEAYLKRQKSIFLKKVGKTEEELNHFIQSNSSEEELMQLNKQFKQAAFELGTEIYQDPLIEKQFSNALDEFENWRTQANKKIK